MTDWQSFYVIVGSSGAALIGIQFVVMALVADMRRLVTTKDSHLRAGRPDGVAHASAGADPDRHGWLRPGSELGRSDRKDPPR